MQLVTLDSMGKTYDLLHGLVDRHTLVVCSYSTYSYVFCPIAFVKLVSDQLPNAIRREAYVDGMVALYVERPKDEVLGTLHALVASLNNMRVADITLKIVYELQEGAVLLDAGGVDIVAVVHTDYASIFVLNPAVGSMVANIFPHGSYKTTDITRGFGVRLERSQVLGFLQPLNLIESTANSAA